MRQYQTKLSRSKVRNKYDSGGIRGYATTPEKIFEKIHLAIIALLMLFMAIFVSSFLLFVLTSLTMKHFRCTWSSARCFNFSPFRKLKNLGSACDGILATDTK